MSRPIIQVSGISKRYRLGSVGARTLRDEFQGLWSRLWDRGNSKAGPFAVPDSTSSIPSPQKQDHFWALRDVSFDVRPGEVIGIIGRNGAGKSTLLKILSRITEPTTGEAVMRGRVASLLEVGTGFHPDLTGRENVFLNGAILGMTSAEIRRKFDEIVDFSEIEKFIDTPVKRYSSGMYVRLAFAVAAHLEPEILILDEVLAVGDAQFQKKCLGKMQSISTQHGRTILFVSHHMAAIRRLCQKCVVLKNGGASVPLAVNDAIGIYTEQGVESEYDLEVAKLPRGQGFEGQVCWVTHVRLAGTRELAFERPFTLEVTIDCKKPLVDGMIGIVFNTVEGSRVLTLDSDLHRKYFDLASGIHVLRASIPSLPLHPGFYQCGVSVAAGGFFHDIVDFATWEVKTSTVDHWSDRGFGACRLDVDVTVLSESDGTTRMMEDIPAARV